MEVEVKHERPSISETLCPSKALGLAGVFFITLQLLDFITTLAAFSRGGIELNPIIRSLMPWTGRFLAISLSKAIVVSLVMLLTRRKRILRFANVLYVAVVVWNIVVFLALKQPVSA